LQQPTKFLDRPTDRIASTDQIGRSTDISIASIHRAIGSIGLWWNIDLALDRINPAADCILRGPDCIDFAHFRVIR